MRQCGKYVQPDRPHMTIKYGAEKMRFACRLTKAVNTDTPTHYK